MATLITQEASAVWSGARLANLNARLTALLNELAQVPGVQSAFVCDNQGRVLGATVSGPADLATLVVKTKRITDRMGRAVAQCLATLQTRGGSKDLEMRFDQRTLVVRDLGNAFVAIILTPQGTPSMIRMTLNVSARPFENDADLQKHLQSAIPARATLLAPDALDALALQLVEKAGAKSR